MKVTECNVPIAIKYIWVRIYSLGNVIWISMCDCINYAVRDLYIREVLSLDLEGFASCRAAFSDCLGQVTLRLHFLKEFSFGSILFCFGLVLHHSLVSGKTVAVFTVLLICTKDKIPPTEGCRVVVGKGHVVEIMVLCAGPERKNVSQRPWEI